MQEEDTLQILRNHLEVVPFDIDRKHFRIAIRAIEARDLEINRLQSIVDSYKKEYPYRDHMLKRTNDA